MEKNKHIKRHKELHKSLDELVADWINQTGNLPSQNTVIDLMNWSSKQMKEPDEKRL